MSRLYESLKRAEAEVRQHGPSVDESVSTPSLLGDLGATLMHLESASTITMELSARSHLVALTDSTGLAAEKFRALAARLEHLRNEQELKSILITSSVMNEGKTLITGNLAVTLAKSGSKVLIIEGDLRRPSLASFLGLKRWPGLREWWSSRTTTIGHYVYKISGMPLCFLGAGGLCDQPSAILQSPEFSEAFGQLTRSFDWIVVDSAPMVPTVDVNLWSRLVDGVLLVVREGVAPVKALEQGLASLDTPKLIGVVFNEDSELARVDYYRCDSERSKKPRQEHKNGRKNNEKVIR
jgi:capsular exopolysaccharide synthesis family protein